jgi:hypothetical protein
VEQLGKDVIFDGNSHPSILKIKNNTQYNTLFDFKPTDVDTINKLVSKINIKKATGVDQISSKLLRAGARYIFCIKIQLSASNVGSK